MERAAMLVAQTAQVDINLRINGLIALVAGILILIFPRLLNYVVAAYLIVIGLIQVFDLRIAA